MLGDPHLIGKKAVIGIINLMLGIVVRLLLHRLIPPVYSKLGDSRLINKDGPPCMADEGLNIGVRAFVLGELVIEDIMDIVANANKLLISIANGNDERSDA